MYNIDKREESCEVVKEGRLVAWYRLRDQGIDIDPQNINREVVMVNGARDKPNEQETFAKFASSAAAQPSGK